MNKKLEWGLLVGILALGIFFRFYNIQSTPPGLYPDEAMNGSNALEALETGDFKIFYPENNGREGLFINIQALSIWAFGAHPWALRIVSAFLGSLTILGVYLLAKELFIASPVFLRATLAPSLVGLFSAFFLATSYWHINFSRIGFRAIMVPLLLSFGLYWLLKAFRTGALISAILAGLMLGLGFHTYIAWRIVPLIIFILFTLFIRRWRKNNLSANPPTGVLNTVPCAPCVAAIISFVGLIALLPMAWYFVEHRADITGRQEQVSVFSAERPAYELLRSTVLELGMFNFKGDCNERHNFQCQSQLQWLVGIFFFLGLCLALRDLFKRESGDPLISITLLTSFVAMMLPAALTREGIPHALRSIGMLVPIMIFSGMGAAWLWQRSQSKLTAALANPEYALRHKQLLRIRIESRVFLAVLSVFIASSAFLTYHIRFAESPEAYFGFSSNLTSIAIYLKSKPDSLKKYVIANGGGDFIRGIPISSQPIMFITKTFTSASQNKHNLFYAREDQISLIPKSTPLLIIPLTLSRELMESIKREFPRARPSAPGDFAVFTVD